MKKYSIVVFVLFSFLFLSSTYAQLEIKPAIGINATSFSEDPSNGETSANVGWQLGGTIAIGDKFYVKAEYSGLTEAMNINRMQIQLLLTQR